MKNWTKIIGYYPINNTKNPSLYLVNLEKDFFSSNKEKITVLRRKVESKKLMREEFIKTDNKK